MKHPRITVFGSINFDILFKQDRLNNIGETIIVKDAIVCGGGKGANQAVQIARLGIIPRLIAPIGNDVLGQSLIEELKQYGVPVENLLQKPGSSGIGIVRFLNDGSLHSTVIEGANGKLTLQDVEASRPVLENCDFLLAQLELPVETVEQAIEIATKSGAKIVLNTAPARPLSEKTLTALDILVANEVEAGYYLGAPYTNGDIFEGLGLEFSHRYGLDLVVTLGPQGSMLFSAGKVTHIPALDVPVVETTGAGDSYVGALLVALAEGRSILDACRFASSASSITIGSIGGQRSMPDRISVLQVYREYFT